MVPSFVCIGMQMNGMWLPDVRAASFLVFNLTRYNSPSAPLPLLKSRSESANGANVLERRIFGHQAAVRAGGATLADMEGEKLFPA